MTTNYPSEGFIVDDDGSLRGHIDFDRLHEDAVRLMYDMAATAGDDDATDAVGAKWAAEHDPDYFGYLAAGALSLLIRNVLAPTLDACTRVGLDLRPGLRDARDNAERTLGDKA